MDFARGARLFSVFLSAVFIASALPLAAAYPVVTFNGPVDALNTTNHSIYFNFTVMNVSDTPESFSNASVWIANVSSLPAGVRGVYWGFNQTANTTILSNVTPTYINVSGLSDGTYRWNVNLTLNDSSNFSYIGATMINRTFTIDSSGSVLSESDLLATTAMLQQFGMPGNNVTFPQPMGRHMAKPIKNMTYWRLKTRDVGSGVKSVQMQNATAANGNPGAWLSAAFESGTVFDGSWLVVLNVTNASDGFSNFAVNVTDYAGNSTMYNLTGRGPGVQELYLDQSSFGMPAGGFAEYFINNWPLVQGRVIDQRTGTALTNSSPSQYNVTVYAKRESFGSQSSTGFSQQYPVDANGEFQITFNESNALPTLGGGGGFGSGPSMYKYYALVVGPNGNTSLASAFTMPQPIGFMAPPGRPFTQKNLYVAPSETVSLRAVNATGNCSSFFGMVMDTSSGVALKYLDNASTSDANCVTASTAWYDVIVPANKAFTITIMNPPFNGGKPFPPRSVGFTTQNISDADTTDFNGSKVNFTINTSFTMVTVNGSMFINNGTPVSPAASNFTCTNRSTGNIDPNCANFTKFEVYMSFGGFIPPMEPEASANATELSNVNGTNGIRYGTGNFSITVPSGVTYTLFAYAESNGTYFMGVTSVTPSATVTTNFTLYRLAGAANRSTGASREGMGDVGEGNFKGGSSGGFNTSMTSIRIVNENFSLLTDTSDPNKNQNGGGDVGIEIETNYSGIQVRRQNRAQSSASVNVPLLQDQQVKIRVYAMQYIPLERTLSAALINANETINVTLKKPEMRPPRRGGVENDTVLSSVRIEFLSSNSTCNTPNYPASCKMDFLRQEGGNASKFQSDQQMISGVVNIVITDTSTNTTTMLVGMDLSSTSMPNMEMDSAPSESRDSGSNKLQTRRVGSFLPSGMVSAIWVANGLNTTTVNDSAAVGNLSNITMGIPYLYDDDGNLVWNASVNSTAQIPNNYQDYVTSYSGQAANASNLTGINCWMNYNSTNLCWIDNSSSHRAWLKVPHFSSVGVQVAAPTSTSTSTTSTSTSTSSSSSSYTGGSGGSVYTTITPTTAPTAAPTLAATPAPTVSATPAPTPAEQPTATATPQQVSAARTQLGELRASAAASDPEVRQYLDAAERLLASGNFARAQAYLDLARQAYEKRQRASATAAATAVAKPAATRAGGFDATTVVAIGIAVLLAIALYWNFSTRGRKK